MTALYGPRLLPSSGRRPRQLVIILHGYAASGDAMFWLANLWSRALPDAMFVTPNANEFQFLGGRQWFPLTVRSASERWRGVNKAAPALEQYIRDELAMAGLKDRACVLMGFSQGAEMALHVGLRWPRPLAGVISFSGLLAGAEHLSSDIRSRPRVLLVHGDRDNSIPVQSLYFTRDTLQSKAVPVEWHIAPGVGHRISSYGVAIGLRFLQSVLPA